MASTLVRAALAAGLALVTGAALAGEITLYERPGFQGRSITLRGNMADLDPSTSAMELACNVQETAEISRQHRLGTGRGDIRFLVTDHLVGDVGVFDAEGAAKPAAHFRAGQFGQGQPVDRGEQPARLVLDPKLAQP